MLYIDYLNNNTWSVLSLGPQCANPKYSYFLFRAIDKDSKEEYLFLSPDYSTNPEYYNRFLIVSSTASDPMNGVINAPASQYTLEVYETPVSELDISKAYGLVNVDILNIVGTHSNIETYNNSGTPINVYKNQNRI